MPICQMISGTKRTKGGGVLEVLSGERGWYFKEGGQGWPC